MNSNRGSVNFDLLDHCQQDELYSEDEEDIYESGDFIWGDFGSSSNYKPSTSSRPPSPDPVIFLTRNSILQLPRDNHRIFSHRTNVKNIRQDSTSNGQSTVIPLPWKPSIVEGLRDQVVAEGEELVFQVKVQGEIKEVKWRKDGQPAEKNSRVKTDKIDNETYRLTITKAELSDAGEFEIQLINDVGKAVSSAHAEIGQIPKIVKGLVPAEINEDDDIVFSVEVSVPVSEVKWYKNGQEIKPSSHFKIQCYRKLNDLEPKKYKLVINKVEMDDGAIYKIILSNKFGSCDSEAALIVNKTRIVKIAKSLRDIAGTTDQNHKHPTILASESNSSSNGTLILDSSQTQSVEMSNPEREDYSLLFPDPTTSENFLYNVGFPNDDSSHNSGAEHIQKKQTIARNDRNSLSKASSKRSIGNPKTKKSTKKAHKCDHCSYVNVHKGDLNKHMRIHTGEKPFKCGQCSYASAQKSNLINHLRIHTGQKRFKCGQCSYSSAWKNVLNRHLRIHTGEKPFKCGQCSYSSAQKGNLDVHVFTHTGEKPYKCEQCSYSSAQKGNLDNHVRTHTGEKPFKCNQCSYAFAERGNLTKHLSIHTGEKPFKCNQCSYASAWKRDLTIHMRKHSGEKPYKCSACSFAGASGTSLHQHVHNYHSKEME